MRRRCDNRSKVTRALVGVMAGALVVLSLVGDVVASQGPSERASGGAAAEVGYGSLGEDSFLNLRLKFGYEWLAPAVGCEDESAGDCRTSLRLAAQAPLRFRMANELPADTSRFRTRDWDEPADFFRLARLVEYGRAGEPLHARFGELGPVSLGHGTLVHDYYNVISIDHYQPGLFAEANTAYGGAEALVSNAVAPSVLGARAYVRPFSFVDGGDFWSRIAVGASLIADLDAPTRLAAEHDQSGSVVDRTYNPIVDDDQVTSLWGVDVEMTLVDSERVDLVPYADLNGHTSLGQGLHAGAFVNYRPTDALELSTQLEYRRVGENYLPDYIGPIYEVDRYQFVGWGRELPAPKVRAAASLEATTAHGYSGSLTAAMEDLFRVSAGYADHQGPDNATLRVQATSHPVEQVQLGLFYYKQYIDSLDEAFEPEGSLAVGEARANLYGPFFALGSYGRMWRVDEDGEYRTVDDWNLGLGVSMGL